MGFPSVHGVVRFRTILKRRTSSAGACFRSCLIRTVSRRSIPAFLRSYLRPSRALHRRKTRRTLRAACLISRPSWRIQRASGNQGNAPAAVGNTSETTMPLERATMPLERVNGPGGRETPPRFRNGRESSLARVASAENSENGAADCGKLSPLVLKTPLRPSCLPVSRTPGSKVGEDAQRGRQHSSKGRLYEYSAENRVSRWETTNALLLENDPKTGGLQGEQFGSGGGDSEGKRPT